MATRQGFEPRPTVLETGMLPLHYRAIFLIVEVFALHEGRRCPRDLLRDLPSLYRVLHCHPNGRYPLVLCHHPVSTPPCGTV